MPDVVTLGETMAVLYPPEPVPLHQAQHILQDIAGAESNLAIWLRSLGHSVRFLSRIGRDPFGERILATLQQYGVDTTWVQIDPQAPTGIFFREWLTDGARRVYYYRAGSAASRYTPADLSAEAFADSRIVHLTGITPVLGPGCRDTVEQAIHYAHAAQALVSFDPNYRAKLWSPAEARATLLPLMALADILLIGSEDAQALFGTDQTNQVLQACQNLGIPTIVLKQAEAGASALIDGQFYHIPAHPVAQVVDPVGAGDAFNAGFLAGIVRGEPAEIALQRGASCGAAAVTVLGDYAAAINENHQTATNDQTYRS